MKILFLIVNISIHIPNDKIFQLQKNKLGNVSTFFL